MGLWLGKRCRRFDPQMCICYLWWGKGLCTQPVYRYWCAHSIVSFHPLLRGSNCVRELVKSSPWNLLTTQSSVCWTSNSLSTLPLLCLLSISVSALYLLFNSLPSTTVLLHSLHIWYQRLEIQKKKNLPNCHFVYKMHVGQNYSTCPMQPWNFLLCLDCLCH